MGNALEPYWHASDTLLVEAGMDNMEALKDRQHGSKGKHENSKLI